MKEFKELQQMYEKMNENEFSLDYKQLKKNYDRRYKTYQYTCRLKITNSHKQYNNIVRSILNIFKVTLEDKENIKSGNAVIVICSISNQFNYLEMMKKRLQHLFDHDLLKEGHEHIIKTLQELQTILYNNLKNPISLKEFEKENQEGDIEDESRQGSIE